MKRQPPHAPKSGPDLEVDELRLAHASDALNLDDDELARARVEELGAEVEVDEALDVEELGAEVEVDEALDVEELGAEVEIEVDEALDVEELGAEVEVEEVSPGARGSLASSPSWPLRSRVAQIAQRLDDEAEVDEALDVDALREAEVDELLAQFTALQRWRRRLSDDAADLDVMRAELEGQPFRIRQRQEMAPVSWRLVEGPPRVRYAAEVRGPLRRVVEVFPGERAALCWYLPRFARFRVVFAWATTCAPLGALPSHWWRGRATVRLEGPGRRCVDDGRLVDAIGGAQTFAPVDLDEHAGDTGLALECVGDTTVVVEVENLRPGWALTAILLDSVGLLLGERDDDRPAVDLGGALGRVAVEQPLGRDLPYRARWLRAEVEET